MSQLIIPASGSMPAQWQNADNRITRLHSIITGTGWRPSTSITLVALLVLWSVGLVLLGFNTGFSLNTVPQSANALLTVMCVATLLVNGLTLGLLYLPGAARLIDSMALSQSALLSLVGAMSTSQWLLIEHLSMR